MQSRPLSIIDLTPGTSKKHAQKHKSTALITHRSARSLGLRRLLLRWLRAHPFPQRKRIPFRAVRTLRRGLESLSHGLHFRPQILRPLPRARTTDRSTNNIHKYNRYTNKSDNSQRTVKSNSTRIFKRVPCTGRLVLNSDIHKLRCVACVMVGWREENGEDCGGVCN